VVDPHRTDESHGLGELPRPQASVARGQAEELGAPGVELRRAALVGHHVGDGMAIDRFERASEHREGERVRSGAGRHRQDRDRPLEERLGESFEGGGVRVVP